MTLSRSLHLCYLTLAIYLFLKTNQMDNSSSTMYTTMYALGRKELWDLNERLFMRVTSIQQDEWVLINPTSYALGQAIYGPLQAGKRSFGEVYLGTAGGGILHGKIEITTE